MKILQIAGIMGLATVVAFSAGVSVANQPNMENALKSLQSAQVNLQRVTPNKGGHDTLALNLVKRAITEVKLGISYANAHK